MRAVRGLAAERNSLDHIRPSSSMPSIDRPHYQHSALAEFAPRAKAFCELVETYADFSLQNFHHSARAGLPKRSGRRLKRREQVCP